MLGNCWWLKELPSFSFIKRFRYCTNQLAANASYILFWNLCYSNLFLPTNKYEMGSIMPCLTFWKSISKAGNLQIWKNRAQENIKIRCRLHWKTKRRPNNNYFLEVPCFVAPIDINSLREKIIPTWGYSLLK